MGKFYRRSYPYTFRSERMNRVYPLGKLCYHQARSHRYYKASYHHLSSPESIFCSSWILWFSSIFSGQRISERTWKQRDSLELDFLLLFSHFRRQLTETYFLFFSHVQKNRPTSPLCYCDHSTRMYDHILICLVYFHTR